MSHLNIGERTFVLDQQEYAAKSRPFLGLSESAVVILDDGTYLGYAGDLAKAKLVKVETHLDGNGNVIDDLPTDFRSAGIGELTNRGVPAELQAKLLLNFMRDFTKEQRAVYVAEYDAAKHDVAMVTDFCTRMLAMLNY